MDLHTGDRKYFPRKEKPESGIFPEPAFKNPLLLTIRDTYPVIPEKDTEIDSFPDAGNGNFRNTLAISEGIVKKIVEYLLYQGVSVNLQVPDLTAEGYRPQELGKASPY